MQLELLYEMSGQVEHRKVLRPNAHGPRMEITFSGSLVGRGRLAAFTGQQFCTFIANPNEGGFYGWRGEAIGFGLRGPAFTARSKGRGVREQDHFVYRGGMYLRVRSPELRWLESEACAFEYRQHATTLAVSVRCHALTGHAT